MNNTFQFTYRVRLDDLDYMGIVGNADWLIFLERARADLLASIDYPMKRLMDEKIGGVVADLKVKYIRPARLDDTFTILVSAKEPSDSSGTLEYVAQSTDGKPHLKAETKMVFVDASGRPTTIPPGIRVALFGNESQ